MPVSHLEVDCVLTNQTGHYIVHARSKYVSRPFNLEARSDVSVKYLFEPMNLAPGMYYAVVYAASGRDVLFWGENIQAFQVHSRPNFGIAEYFEHLKGVVMPPYRVSLEKGASPS